MRQAGHDALVAFSQDNVTYTAGFLVPSHASNRFRRTITVHRRRSVRRADRGQCRGEPGQAALALLRHPLLQPVHRGSRRPARRRVDRSGRRAGQIAIELDYMPAQDYIRLRERLPQATLVPCRDLYFNARMIKTEEEIAVLTEVGRADRSRGRRGAARDPAGNDREIGGADHRQQDAGGWLRRPQDARSAPACAAA